VISALIPAHAAGVPVERGLHGAGGEIRLQFVAGSLNSRQRPWAANAAAIGRQSPM